MKRGFCSTALLLELTLFFSRFLQLNSYSTQHFQSILSYKKAGLNYGILAGLSLIGTAILMVRQKASGGGKSPADREIELLPAAAGGSLA